MPCSAAPPPTLEHHLVTSLELPGSFVKGLELQRALDHNDDYAYTERRLEKPAAE